MKFFLAIPPKEQSVQILRMKDGTQHKELTGHDGDVRSAIFSSDGRFVVTASDDHTARIWTRAQGAEQRYSKVLMERSLRPT